MRITRGLRVRERLVKIVQRDIGSRESIHTRHEIGMLGQRGLDYASPDQKYTLESVPDEKFSGLHLMCMMYAGFKRVAPEHDLHMDLNEPFLTALEMFQNGETGAGE